MKSTAAACLLSTLITTSVSLGPGTSAAHAENGVVAAAAMRAPAEPIRIENRRSGKCLEVARTGIGPPMAPGARVQQYTCQSGDDHTYALNNADRAGAQRWTTFLQETGPAGNFYLFKTVLTHQCLEVNQAGITHGLGNDAFLLQMPCNGSPQQQWQQFKRKDGLFWFQNRRSGKCLEVDQANANAGMADGNQVIQFRCHAGAQQLWKMH